MSAASPSEPSTSRSFTAAAWGFVAYLIGVILMGAWVRISGSGAGCGDHWPDCHGQLVPLDPSTQTIIEYTHRVTSGLCGIFAIALAVWAWRRFGRRHRVFAAAALALLFVIFEGAIGAGLVKGELVADDDSVARAVVIALHLVNTLMLTGASALCAWWSTGRPLPRLTAIRDGASSRLERALPWLLGFGLVGLVVTSMTGAVTALGDTLFPVDPTVDGGLFDGGLLERVRDDLSPARHFLVRLRILHPVVAVSVAFYWLVVSARVRDAFADRATRQWSTLLAATVLLECVAGGVNVALGAPGWLQLVHLFMAQIVWIAALVTSASALSPRAQTSTG